MRTSRVLLILLVLAVIIAAGYILIEPTVLDPWRPVTTVSDPAKVNEMTLAFVGAPFPDDYGLLRVPGWVDNKSSQKMRTVTLEIQLLDEKGAKTEKISYDVENIDPMTRKTFDINAGTLPSSRTATISISQVELIK